MKKIISLIMVAVCFLLPFSTFFALAEESSNTSVSMGNAFGTPTYEKLRENSITYSCQYDDEAGRIRIQGNVSHEIMISYKGCSVELYSVEPGKDISEILNQKEPKPLLSTPLAVNFEFSVSVDASYQRFSRYAIVLRTEDGNRLLAAEPRYAGTPSTYHYEKNAKEFYKGISSDRGTLYDTWGFGTAIIPVYLDRLLSDTSNGYLYPVEQGYRYFNKMYIDRLDAQVRTYSASDTKVYLQLLLPSGAESALKTMEKEGTFAQYVMPDVYDRETMALISAFSSFLAERYVSYKSGQIEGLVIGASIDRSDGNYCGGLSLDQYAEEYAFYTVLISQSAFVHNPDLDIIIPFSDANGYEGDFEVFGENYHPAELLETILSYLNAGVGHRLQCNTMIEYTDTPVFEIVEEEQSAESRKTGANRKLEMGKMGVYSAYLSKLSRRFSCAPTHFIAQWTVDIGCEDNAFSAAYSYGFYSMIANDFVSAFVVSDRKNPTVISDHSELLSFIDTSEGWGISSRYLSTVGISSWQELMGTLKPYDTVLRNTYRAQAVSLSKPFYGTFKYAEFSDGTTGEWVGGSSCIDVKVDYNSEGERALYAAMDLRELTGYSEVLYLPEYPENMVHTQVLSFDMLIDEGNGKNGTVYEIIISMGNGSDTIVSEQLVKAGERTEIRLSVGEFVKNNVTKYIRIGIRALSSDVERATLGLYGISGFSEIYSDQELSELVEEERRKIRDIYTGDSSNSSDGHLSWIIFGVILAVTTVGVGVFIGSRKDDASPNQEISDKRTENKTTKEGE